MSRARDLASLMSQGNLLQDGVISTTEVDGVTATSAELNKLDGVTANTTELNKLAGVTASTAEINKLTGVTASTTELNKLTGLTASTTDLNNVAGINSSVQTQIDTKAPTANPTFTGTATAPTINASTALKIGGTEIVDNNRQLKNIASVDATTVAALSNAGVGSGGGKFSATADGAIAIGKPVALQSNGTVKQVLEQITENNPISSLGSSGISPSPANADYGYGGLYYWPDTSYDTQSGSGIHVWGTGADVYLTTSNFTPSSNAFSTWHGNVFLGDTHDGSGIASAFDPSTGRLLVVWRGSNGYLRNGFLRVYADSNGQLQYNLDSNNQTSKQVRASSGRPISASFSPTDGHFRVGYIDNNSAVRVITYEITGNAGSSPTLTEKGSPIIQSNQGNSEDHWMAHDSINNRFMLTYQNGAASGYGTYRYFSTSTSNGAVTNHAGGNFYNGYIYYTRTEFNPQDSCFLTVFYYSGNIGMKQIDVASDGTVSVVGGASTVFQENTAHQGQRMHLKYDADSKKIVFVRRSSLDSTKLTIMKINTSGSSISKEAETELASHGVNNMTAVAAIEEHKLFVTAQAQNNGAFRYLTVAIASATSNNTSWIGFAESAISDTASGDILVMGSTAENQSGLTIGSTYYVQLDGTIATTSTGAIKAGRAIAANKLLITEGNAA